jgi:YD repeat-containing protein
LESTFADGTTPRQDMTFSYTDAGRLERRTEPLGRITEFEYDGVGNLVEETLRDGSSARSGKCYVDFARSGGASSPWLSLLSSHR